MKMTSDIEQTTSPVEWKFCFCGASCSVESYGLADKGWWNPECRYRFYCDRCGLSTQKLYSYDEAALQWNKICKLVSHG